MDNRKTLVLICGYQGRKGTDAPGDVEIIRDLLPLSTHHGCPVVIMSPDDSPITHMGPHICRTGGKRAYIGQASLDRQWLHMKMALEYDFDFYLFNDADSFVLTPQLPDYLFDNQDTVFSNEVTDFRKPGETWEEGGQKITWAADYHAGFPLIAMQPPYFLGRKALEQLVSAAKGYGDGDGNAIPACPVTPFIDWYWVQLCVNAGVKHRPFLTGASCETVTPNGLTTMANCVTNNGATFIHSIKSKSVADQLVKLHRQNEAIKAKK